MGEFYERLLWITKSFSSRNRDLHHRLLGTIALTQQSGTSWAWFDVNGGQPTVSVAYSYPTLRTAYGCTSQGLTDYNAAGELPTNISFPDGSSYGMTWEANPTYTSAKTGRIASFTNRAGSTVSYNYNPSSAANDGLNCIYLVPNKMTRTTSDGTVTYTWAAVNNGGGNWGSTTTKVDVTTYTRMITPSLIGA